MILNLPVPLKYLNFICCLYKLVHLEQSSVETGQHLFYIKYSQAGLGGQAGFGCQAGFSGLAGLIGLGGQAALPLSGLCRTRM